MQSDPVLVLFDTALGFINAAGGVVLATRTPSTYAVGTTLASIASGAGVTFAGTVRLVTAHIVSDQNYYQ